MKVRTKVALVLGALAAALAGALVLSRSSGDPLEALLGRLRREGRLPTVAELRSAMPELDPDLQERAWTWMLHPDTASVAWGDPEEDWWASATDTAPMPERLGAWFERFRRSAGVLADLLRSGRVRLSSLAWRVLDATDPERAAATVSPWFRSARVPSIEAVNSAARWFALASRADPGALALLDRLAESFSPPGGTFDAALGLHAARVRDEAYLLAALRGRLSEDDLDRWAADPPPPNVALADGMRAERALHWEPVARWLLEARPLAGGSWKGDLTRPDRIWRRHVSPWLRGTEDCRRFLEHQVALEDAVRRGKSRALAEALPATDGLGWPFGELFPDVETTRAGAIGYARTWATQGALQRAVRLVAVLGRDASRGLSLPASAEEARERLGPRAAWLDGGPMVFGLAYERLAEDRVRWTVVPRTLLPDVEPGGPVPLDPGPDRPATAPETFSWRADGVEARIPSR